MCHQPAGYDTALLGLAPDSISLVLVGVRGSPGRPSTLATKKKLRQTTQVTNWAVPSPGPADIGSPGVDNPVSGGSEKA